MKLILLALVFSISIWSTHAYKCYVCDSVTDVGCGDTFNKAKALEAWKIEAKPNERCQKTKAVGSLISRSIVDVNACIKGENKCQTVSVPIVGETSTGCCKSDMCNGVSSIRQQSFVVFGIITTIIMLVYRRF